MLKLNPEIKIAPTAKIIAVAPMMACTDRHDRYFLRLIAPNVHLYTEMITTYALIHGNAQRLLEFHPAEKYVALQLGGSEPNALAKCAKMGEDAGYDEINLNVGCPSPRVSSARFGACLMREPKLVADSVSAMTAKVQIPVTVKCRIGVDEEDSYSYLHNFIQSISQAGCSTFIIHARKAWLNGLSPKENREIPPLRYEVVHQLKKDFSQLKIILNGGIKTLAEIDKQINLVDGVMIGREAYSNPYLLASIQQQYYDHDKCLTRTEIIERMIPYIENQVKNNIRLQTITRHITGLFHGQRGSASWRRYISEHAHKPGAGVEVIKQALTIMQMNEIVN